MASKRKASFGTPTLFKYYRIESAEGPGGVASRGEEVAESSINIASTEEKSTRFNQRLSEAESEVSAVHTSSGTSVNEATEATE